MIRTSPKDLLESVSATWFNASWRFKIKRDLGGFKEVQVGFCRSKSVEIKINFPKICRFRLLNTRFFRSSLVIRDDNLICNFSHSAADVYQDGVVLVYKDGRQLTFYGHRSPEVLIAFLIKVRTRTIPRV